LFARKPEFVDAIARALAQGEKRYTALVRGITRDKGVVNRPLREHGTRIDARTRYRRVAVKGGHSLLEVRPDQGRKHQIRRHLAEVGHPVLGDDRYGHEPSNRHAEHKHGLERPFLHCASIALELDGVVRRFEAPLAGDLDSVLASLGSTE
jgi:23S rRNA (uracil1939-C5)-methyltransferase